MKQDFDFDFKLKYPIIIDQDDNETYHAEYADLKGCMTVDDSLLDITESIQDAKKHG